MSAITRLADKAIPGWQDVSGKKVVWESVLVLTAIIAYTRVRNQFGSRTVAPEVAADNAEQIVAIEQAIGLYFELDVQQLFLDNTTFLQFWNIYYFSLHFTVPLVVAVFLFLRFPEKYRFWRRTLGVTSLLGLIGYAVYPLMPPRLLGSCGTYGGCRTEFTFVDTLVTAGGFINFENEALASVSNQFAAMPSLHMAWAMWVAFAMVPQLRTRYGRFLFGFYPFGMLFAIIVTGNHFILDAIAGAAVLAAGYVVSIYWERVTQKRRAQRSSAEAGTENSTAPKATVKSTVPTA